MTRLQEVMHLWLNNYSGDEEESIICACCGHEWKSDDGMPCGCGEEE